MGWQVEKLTLADRDAALALSTEAGWNQTTADWSYLLSAGQGFGTRAHGRLIATSLALPYAPDFGWVSMVLVTERYRRQGLATLLLHAAVDHLHGQHVRPMLDATPAGRAVYSRLGFLDIEQIDRWQGIVGTARTRRPRQTSDLGVYASLDLTAFGADRMGLLTDLVTRLDAVVSCDEGGYAVARAGRLALHIGPVVARTAEGGVRLLRQLLDGVSGAVIADVPRGSEPIAHELLERGFTVQRSFQRMALGRDEAFGERSLVRLIGGPELG